MKRKLIAFVCVVASLVLLYLSCVNVSAAGIVKSGSCGDNVTYTLDSAGVLTISGSGIMYNYGSYTSTPWYDWKYNVETVVILNGVTSIGNNAFRSKESIRKVTIPGSVTRIGERAFEECDGLMNITIPNGVKMIGQRAFEDCKGLMNVSFSDTVTNIDDYAFYRCTGLTSVTIPGSVKTIGVGTFENCTSLENLTFCDSSNNYTNIGQSAFEGCTSLVNVTFGTSVKAIGLASFDGCSSLKQIVIPKNVEKIDFWSFRNCINLTHRTISNFVDVDSEAFKGCPAVHNGWGTGRITTSPTCISKGVKTYNCSVSGCTVTKTEEIAALGHKVVKDSAVAATCTKTGLTEGSHCSVCNTVIKKQETIKALGHKTITDAAVAATCTKTGLTAGSHCSVCKTVITAQSTIPALGHDFSGSMCNNTDGTISFKCIRCDVYGGGTKRLTQDNIDVLVAPVEMTASTVLASANDGKIADKAGNEITDKNTPLATGMKVILGETSVTISVAGDVDGSGDISVSDARLALRAAVKLDTLTGADFTSADVDFSGDISVSDARLILRAAVKLDDPKKAWIK